MSPTLSDASDPDTSRGRRLSDPYDVYVRRPWDHSTVTTDAAGPDKEPSTAWQYDTWNTPQALLQNHAYLQPEDSVYEFRGSTNDAAETWFRRGWPSQPDVCNDSLFFDEGYMSRQATCRENDTEFHSSLLLGSSGMMPRRPDVQPATTSGALQCLYPGCNQLFADEFREGKLARHEKSLHGMSSPAVYCCDVLGCEGLFIQKHAREIHYGTRHSRLVEDPCMDFDRNYVATHSAGSLLIERARRGRTLPIELRSADQLSMSPDTILGNFVAVATEPVLSVSAPTSRSAWQGISWAHSPRSDKTIDPTDLEFLLDQSGASQSIENSRSKRFVCPKCPSKSFGRQAELRRHVLNKHESNPQLSCPAPQCSRLFPTHRKDKLRDHVRKSHKGTVTTNAGSLEFDIPKEETLVEEMEDLKQTATYACSNCELEFERKSLLTQHEARKHIRRFKCEKCDMAFHLNADLKRHKETKHRTAFDFLECPHTDCNETFTRQDNLQRHLRKIHGSTSSLKSGPAESTAHELLEDIVAHRTGFVKEECSR